MPMLSAARKKSLWRAASLYRESLPGSPAEELLGERDLLAGGEPYGLGFVRDPLPGHEPYVGRLAIPYLRWAPVTGWSCVGLRFRCARHGCRCADHAKYLSEPNAVVTPYNTRALVDDHDVVAVTEGELDAISAELCGIPAVGFPGVESWTKTFGPLFAGYSVVPILADNDRPQFRKDCPRCRTECRGHNPGMEFAKTVAKDVPEARILPWEVGEDTNSTMVRFGRDYVRDRVLSGARSEEDNSF